MPSGYDAPGAFQRRRRADIHGVCYLGVGERENTMSMHREERGLYLIEASACHLPGNKWQPRLTMTRLRTPRELSKSQAFPGLTPSFDTAKNATRYATDLGRTLADQGSPRLKI